MRNVLDTEIQKIHMTSNFAICQMSKIYCKFYSIWSPTVARRLDFRHSLKNQSLMFERWEGGGDKMLDCAVYMCSLQSSPLWVIDIIIRSIFINIKKICYKKGLISHNIQWSRYTFLWSFKTIHWSCTFQNP